MKAERGDEALRRFRVSQPDTDYFSTTNRAEKNGPVFSSAIRESIRTEIDAIDRDGHWKIRGAVIMPDHVHLLVNLGHTLPLSRVVARLKSKTRTLLTEANLRWQDNYYEHRLRADDDIGHVPRYIFLNPYRAGLLHPSASYPWFWLGDQEKAWFEPGLDDGRPFAEWLR